MMKKFVENGINSFEKHEILEILLFNIFTRCNTNDISHRLLNEFKSIKGVLNADVSELTSIKGVGESAAIRMRFLGECFNYLALEPVGSVVLDTNDRVLEYCKDIVDISAQEFFVIFFLDKKHTLVSKYFVKGHFNFVTPVKKDIALKAMIPGCRSAVAVHNHMGDLFIPSSHDVTSTNNLKMFLEGLNIFLYDHLVLCDGSFYSIRNSEAGRNIWEI